MDICLRLKFSFSLVAVILSCTLGLSASGEDLVSLEKQASDITGQYVATLLPTLQQALASGGPVKGIEVCSTRAPEIAEQLSAETGWSVRRVSLKARNSQKATPDEWEREMLSRFDEHRRDGQGAAALNESAVVEGEFRYLQAQLAMPLCLTCHGSSLSEDVSTALEQHYPADMATGYEAGQVRGAISLRHPID